MFSLKYYFSSSWKFIHVYFLTHFALLLVNCKLILIEPSFYTYYICFIGKLFLTEINTLKCVSVGTPNTINFPFSRRAVVSYWRKYVHEVLVNRLGGLSLPRKSVVRLTDRPDMTLDVYRGRKTTMQQQPLIFHLSQMEN